MTDLSGPFFVGDFGSDPLAHLLRCFVIIPLMILRDGSKGIRYFLSDRVDYPSLVVFESRPLMEVTPNAGESFRWSGFGKTPPDVGS